MIYYGLTVVACHGITITDLFDFDIACGPRQLTLAQVE